MRFGSSAWGAVSGVRLPPDGRSVARLDLRTGALETLYDPNPDANVIASCLVVSDLAQDDWKRKRWWVWWRG